MIQVTKNRPVLEQRICQQEAAGGSCCALTETPQKSPVVNFKLAS